MCPCQGSPQSRKNTAGSGRTRGKQTGLSELPQIDSRSAGSSQDEVVILRGTWAVVRVHRPHDWASQLRCTATALSTCGMPAYPLAEETDERLLAVKGAIHDFVGSSCISGKKGTGAERGCEPRPAQRNQSSSHEGSGLGGLLTSSPILIAARASMAISSGSGAAVATTPRGAAPPHLHPQRMYSHPPMLRSTSYRRMAHRIKCWAPRGTDQRNHPGTGRHVRCVRKKRSVGMYPAERLLLSPSDLPEWQPVVLCSSQRDQRGWRQRVPILWERKGKIAAKSCSYAHNRRMSHPRTHLQHVGRPDTEDNDRVRHPRTGNNRNQKDMDRTASWKRCSFRICSLIWSAQGNCCWKGRRWLHRDANQEQNKEMKGLWRSAHFSSTRLRSKNRMSGCTCHPFIPVCTRSGSGMQNPLANFIGVFS